jgi:hypothetical protein
MRPTGKRSWVSLCKFYNAFQPIICIVDYGEFDDIVCGSGFCALAYIDAALKLNPYRKILLLERGGD